LCNRYVIFGNKYIRQYIRRTEQCLVSKTEIMFCQQKYLNINSFLFFTRYYQRKIWIIIYAEHSWIRNNYFFINSVWFHILVRIKITLSRWPIDLQRPLHRYTAGTDYKSFVRSWFMNSIAPPSITMEILFEIGRTKIIVRRVDLTKSALIRAVARSFFF
jgi:hypothetical protein